MTKKTLVLALGAAVVTTGLMSGCAKTINQRGYLIDEDIVSEIRPGVDNRASVAAAMGTPSVKPSFDESTWFYISRTQESWAFFKPELTAHEVVSVSFDSRGNVTSVDRVGMDAIHKVNHVDRTTPTRGKELGFFEQIFSNIGRFSGGGPAQPGN